MIHILKEHIQKIHYKCPTIRTFLGLLEGKVENNAREGPFVYTKYSSN